MQNLVAVDPVSAADAASTPMCSMFRCGRCRGERKPLSPELVRAWTRTLMVSIVERPEQFGTHSYRIGGAIAHFAAGADATVIRTMG
eukprot:7382508-Prymnesium_polylepis.1